MSFTLNNPFQYWGNPNKSMAVGLGKLYVGKPDLDPTTPANQVTVKALQQDGTEVTLSQPIQLLAGGVPSYNDSPVQLLIDVAEVSIKVTTSGGAQVYYTPRWYGYVSGADLAAINSSIIIAGATAGSLVNKAQQFRTPEDFGAAGDGIVDDTTPVQNWLSFLAANPQTQGVANNNYLINSVGSPAINGLFIFGVGTFKALGSSRLNMFSISNAAGFIAINGVTFDGSNLVARPFEIKNLGTGISGSVYIGESANFINAKNIAPAINDASAFRVQGKFSSVIFEGLVDGVDNSVTSGGVSVGAWFDWSGTDYINNVVVTSKARIKNVKNDNTVTADCDGIQRMGPTTQRLSFVVAPGAYFENCKGRSIKSQVTSNAIDAPIIYRNAYDGLVEIDLQYSGGHVRGAQINYDGVKVNIVIGATTRVGLPSDCTMSDNVLTIKNGTASKIQSMCSFSADDPTDTIKQKAITASGNKVFGDSVQHLVSVRASDDIDSNRVVIKDNYADSVSVSYLNVFEVFNNPAQLNVVFSGNRCGAPCNSATLSAGARIVVELDSANSGIAAMPVSPLTIVAGELALYGGTFIKVDTQGEAAADDLDTIVGASYSGGEIVNFRLTDPSRTVTFKNGTGNLFLSGADFTLNSYADRISLSYDKETNQWCEISRSNNG